MSAFLVNEKTIHRIITWLDRRDNEYARTRVLEAAQYQCSEGTVPERPLYLAFNDVKGIMACEIVRRLPAYDVAEWA